MMFAPGKRFGCAVLAAVLGALAIPAQEHEADE